MKQLIFVFIGLMFLFTACAGNAVPSGEQSKEGTNDSEQVSQGTEGETLEEEEALNTQEPVSKQEVPFVPQADPPTGLAPELEEQIKRDYITLLLKYYIDQGKQIPQNYDNINLVTISGVFGEYHGCIALMIKHDSDGITGAIWEEEIGNYTFVHGGGQGIDIWTNGQFYSLEDAYEQGILTEDDVGGIYASYTNR